MKFLKKISLFIVLSFSISIFFLDTNAWIKKEVKLTQEISDNEWHKLDWKVDTIFLEFLDGQNEAWIKTDKTKIAVKLDNWKNDWNNLHNDSLGFSEEKNFSKILEANWSQWIKIESNWKVIVYWWVDDKNLEIKSDSILWKWEKIVASTKEYISKLTWNVSVISRKKWWADESIRYNYSKDAKNASPRYDVQAWEASCNVWAKWKSETNYAKVIYSDNWNALLWPNQYSSTIKKIVVHHTAESDKSYNLPWEQKVRSIYRYHTLTRWWGDIWYNFIIDQKWNIYEWRSWWDYVVWAHAKCNNLWTIWISLMWNFQNQNPTSKQLTSLAKLTAALWVKYSLNPSTSWYFHWKKTTNILWHRDVWSTACPWDNLYRKLPNIAKQIELSDFNFNFNDAKEYSWGNIAQVESSVKVIEMQPTSYKTIKFTYKNIWKDTWWKWTWLYVSDNNNKDLYASSIFADKNYVAANLIEDKVLPWWTGHFEVEINSWYRQWLYSLEFIPIINWTTKFTKWTIIQPIKVAWASNSYEFLQLKAPPKEIYAGQSFTAKIKLENTWNTIWYRSWNSAMTIKTYPQNRKSKFVTEEDWYDPTVLARLVEKEIKPWEVWTFEFSLRAPLDHWEYWEKFIPTIWDNIVLWDRSMQFDMLVKKPNYRAQLLRTSKETDFLTWEKKTVRLWLKNLSDVFWEEEQISFKVVRSWGLKFDSYDYYIPEFVPKFQAGYANVTIQAPKKPWKYIATLQALANGKKFERLWKFELEINVEKANLSWILTYQSAKELFLKKWETEKVTVRIKNKTNKNWYKNWSNRLSARTTNSNSPLYSSKWISQTTVAEMKESKVAPWNTWTFEIYVKANKEWYFTENFFIRSNSVWTINWWNFLITVKSWETLSSNKKTETLLNYDWLTLKQKIEMLKNRRKEVLSPVKKDPVIEKNESENFVIVRRYDEAIQEETINQNETNTWNSGLPHSASLHSQWQNNEINSQWQEDEISVKLSFPHNASRIEFIWEWKIILDQKELTTDENSIIWTRSDWNYNLIVNIDWNLYRWKEFQAIAVYENSFVRLANWNHSPSWNPWINDNFYRWKIIIKAWDSNLKWKIDVINKLWFENYLKWIAEVPESSSNEKRKALSVVSRSYAMHYTKTEWRKFPWKTYDASDSPQVFQKYLWAWYELRSPLWQQTLKETKWEILTYNWEILRTAYFSCSNWKTKNPIEASWNSTYFQWVSEVYKSVDDIYWKDLTNYNKWKCWHWVWLSGLWAENLAKMWWSYKKILYYYYQDVIIEKK